MNYEDTASAGSASAPADKLGNLVMHERRVWVRYTSDASVSCRATGAMKDAGWPGKIWNISAGGVGLLLRHRFERGTRLLVELTSARGGLQRTMEARVVHARAVVAEGNYGWLLGCVFSTELSHEELEAFRAKPAS